MFDLHALGLISAGLAMGLFIGVLIGVNLRRRTSDRQLWREVHTRIAAETDSGKCPRCGKPTPMTDRYMSPAGLVCFKCNGEQFGDAASKAFDIS